MSYLILPHGAMVFDGMPNCDVNEATAKRKEKISQQLQTDCSILFDGCMRAVKIVSETKPDLIFLNTPHGISLTDAFGVYLNDHAEGNAEWNKNWGEFGVDINLDYATAKLLIEHLRKDGIPSEGISAFSRTEMPLRWGEAIPLWFLKEITNSGAKVVIFTNPTNLVKGLAPVSERVKIGLSISKFIRSLSRRVLYVVSGDLAHTHKTDCQLQLYLPDPRWQMPLPEDERIPLYFDIAIENWIKAIPYSQSLLTEPMKSTEEVATSWSLHVIRDAENWLVKATELKGLALSCGIYGFGILHGLLQSEIELGYKFKVDFLCRLAPTYYGMMVAAVTNVT